jgi:hypothetical protein
LIVPRRPLEKASLSGWSHFQYIIKSKLAKILFIGQSKYYARPKGELKIESKKSQEVRTSFWPRAKRAEGRKINGRRYALPTKKSVFCQKVSFWCNYTVPLELILSKIPEQRKIAARFARGISHPAAPPLGSRLAPKSAKIFFHFLLRGACKKFFQLR